MAKNREYLKMGGLKSIARLQGASKGATSSSVQKDI